jgi:hypothetical protein
MSLKVLISVLLCTSNLLLIEDAVWRVFVFRGMYLFRVRIFLDQKIDSHRDLLLMHVWHPLDCRSLQKRIWSWRLEKDHPESLVDRRVAARGARGAVIVLIGQPFLCGIAKMKSASVTERAELCMTALL